VLVMFRNLVRFYIRQRNVLTGADPASRHDPGYRLDIPWRPKMGMPGRTMRHGRRPKEEFPEGLVK
jgi:hypothetical protein